MDGVRFDELFFFFFGFEMEKCESLKDDDQKEMINVCSDKAYSDMCRTLRYKDDKDYIEEIKLKMRKEVNDLMCVYIKKYDNKVVSKYDYSEILEVEKLNDFDKWHYMLTNEIIKKCNEKGIFKEEGKMSIGRAQKWINMTLKYMRVMNILPDTIKEEELHIPIDSYILAAVKNIHNKEDDVRKLGINVEEYKISTWSSIDNYVDYLKFQKSITNKIRENNKNNKKNNNMIAIEWESKAWIAEAIDRANENK